MNLKTITLAFVITHNDYYSVLGIFPGPVLNYLFQVANFLLSGVPVKSVRSKCQRLTSMLQLWVLDLEDYTLPLNPLSVVYESMCLIKKSNWGSPVKCGEYFPVRKEMEYLLPSAGKYMHVFDVPEEVIDNVCKTIRVISPKGDEYEFEFRLIRSRSDHSRARIGEGSRKTGWHDRFSLLRTFSEITEICFVGKVKANSIRTKIVIAADGFPSKIAKASGILTEDYVTPNNVAINYEFLMSELDVDQSVTEMYLGTNSPREVTAG